ncbi:MAG: glycosyl hydrolase [Planctomycetia bacterium]|nr:glycosyl hydrolase [Planctomycetia bacterium]
MSFLFSLVLFTASLTPQNVTQFFVVPEQEATFVFVCDGETSDRFQWFTTDGASIGDVQAQRSGTTLMLRATLSRGYYELVHPQTGKRFGVVAIAACVGEKDPFFCMDGAISWLVRKNEPLRLDYIRIAARSGVFMLRDRLRWGQIQPRPDALDLETNAHYDAFRKNCEKFGVKVLELCHDAPDWMEKTKEKYPRDFVKTYETWSQIISRWKSTWGGMEVWNEPDISFGAELPADQYMSLFKTFAYLWKETGCDVPLTGPVVSYCHPLWLDNAAANGLLKLCDVFSFHTYAQAPEMEGLFANYQDFLKQENVPGKPIWITECGRPWKIGPERPPMEQDFLSATDIIMKGVLAKACGFEGYFPFVYPYYEERQNNFGMMSKDGTPLRSMAAYAVMIEELSKAAYVGDLKLSETESRWVLLFENPASPEDLTLVVYTRQKAGENVMTLPFAVRSARRLTGEMLPVEGNTVRYADSLIYLRAARAEVEKYRNTETWMAAIRKSRSETTLANVPAVPVVLQYRYHPDEITPSPNGYHVGKEYGKDFVLEIAATNLSDQEIRTPVVISAEDSNTRCVGPEEITIPAQSCVTFPVTVNLGLTKDTAKNFTRITLSAVDSLVLDFSARATLEQFLDTMNGVKKLEIRDPKNWIASASGKTKFSQTGDAWGVRVHFGEGDRWAYPQWNLPNDLDLSRYRGFVIRARCWDPKNQTQVRMFCYQPRGAFFTANSILQPNGEWQTVKVPFTQFTRCHAAGGDPETTLDLKKVTRISVGGNTKNETLFLEVDAVYLYE